MRNRILLAALLLGAYGFSAQQLTQPGSLTLPVGGGALAIRDLNKDGKPDIVTAARDSVTVYLGDGRKKIGISSGWKINGCN
jgi:hypothetical protein